MIPITTNLRDLERLCEAVELMIARSKANKSFEIRLDNKPMARHVRDSALPAACACLACFLKKRKTVATKPIRPNFRLLEKLARAVELVNPAQFRMGTWLKPAADLPDSGLSPGTPCGNVGCAIGHGVLLGLFKSAEVRSFIAERFDKDKKEWVKIPVQIIVETEEYKRRSYYSWRDGVEEELGLTSDEFDKLFVSVPRTLSPVAVAGRIRRFITTKRGRAVLS